jgi:hypothetical protein
MAGSAQKVVVAPSFRSTTFLLSKPAPRREPSGSTRRPITLAGVAAAGEQAPSPAVATLPTLPSLRSQETA